MTIISKTAGILSLTSSFLDMHRTALIRSKAYKQKYEADSFISSEIASTKTNGLSVKDTNRKKWLMKNNKLPSIAGAFGYVKGYLSGLAETSVRYIPNIILSACSLFAKNKKFANISAICLGGVEIFDFIKNSTKFGQKHDYLRK